VIVELQDNIDPRTVSAVYGRAKLVVGMRLHACVMAYGRRTPFVAIAYHPKLHGFAATVGASDFVLPRQARPQAAKIYGYRFEDTGIDGEQLAPLVLAR
jgi:polysaccharide pyruvyl transferase WcaK-like protein